MLVIFCIVGTRQSHHNKHESEQSNTEPTPASGNAYAPLNLSKPKSTNSNREKSGRY